MNRALLAALAGASLLTACTAAELPNELHGPEPMSRAEVDAVIYQHIEAEGDFAWSDADDLTLWSAVVHGGYVVSVGYTEAPAAKALPDGAESDTRSALLGFIAGDLARSTGTAEKSSQELLVYDEDVLPVLDVEIDSYETLIELRQRSDVRYVEPLGYLTEEDLQKSDAGCSNDPESNIPAEDFDVVSPGATVPWNFIEMGIPEAWELSTGQGVTVAVIDTGTSATQARLGRDFAIGESTGRFIERVGTFRKRSSDPPDGPDDDCGHGTLMNGTAAAPRAEGGAIAGVANGANLLAIRATDDVIINSSNEKKGVADALVLAADRDDVKVISMSLGHVFSSSRVADAIRYAHGRGKLIFAAAGTSTSFTRFVGVVFPARMDETVAVTGITDGVGFERCKVCHAGSAVDFVVIMQRDGDSDRTSLSLAMSGNTPGRVGGSSTATATMAGVAALVWARNPALSRDQVLQILREASSEFPGRDSDFGYGTVDAALAVSLAGGGR
ncbi:S8 family serine peptidase [Haliangium sp.]|uniref:S8 family serine peptidase n=1 Tax=Haliangium sp. TaxID=2663208 RepID=UPI003D0F9E34